MSYECSAKSVTVKDFKKICRTCFSEDNISPILQMIVGDLKAVDLLEYSVSLQVHPNDFLPQNICSTCIKEVYRFYEFKKQCHDNESVLKLLLQNAAQNEEELEKSNNDLEESFACNITLIEEDAEIDYGEDNHYNDSNEEKDSSSKEAEDDKKDMQQRHVRRKVYKKKRESYKCRDCPNTYPTRDELKEHRKRVKHPEIRSHACKICNKMFTSSKLRQHMRSHTKEKPYKCEICLQAFSMSGNLKRHIMTHTGERPHVCNTCGKGFIQATSLHSHQKTHLECDKVMSDSDGVQKFTCNFCGRRFKRLTPFNAHLEKHTTDKKIVKGENNKSDPGNNESREHVCEICNRGYKTKHLLKAHQLTHGEKSFLCSDCGKGFVTKAALQSHLKVHTGEKPHTCVICKKSFAHVGSFDSHMLIHSGQKPYSCNFCPKSFTQLSHLTYHLRTHSGERPYSCSYCGKSFALKGNLTVHVRTHTGETPYLCNVCGKGFYDSSSMKKHRRNHKEESVQLHLQQPQIIPPQQSYQIPVINSMMSQINVS